MAPGACSWAVHMWEQGRGPLDWTCQIWKCSTLSALELQCQGALMRYSGEHIVVAPSHSSPALKSKCEVVDMWRMDAAPWTETVQNLQV
jgi:hypothetical protein